MIFVDSILITLFTTVLSSAVETSHVTAGIICLDRTAQYNITTIHDQFDVLAQQNLLMLLSMVARDRIRLVHSISSAQI